MDELTDEDLNELCIYNNGKGKELSMPRKENLHHIIVHNAHHRGQIALDLRLPGHSPGNFDLRFYIAEQRGVKAW